jgi:predicted unusual protein kinase regulating ubiquinone biosynthesis (AarF/ABC1/UbiB family)
MSDFPSSKFERGRIIAKTGLKVGTNYAQRYLKKRITGKEESAKDFHSANAREVFKEFTKLRGTALKIAQGMSMDQGFLPEEFAEVMTQAQYSVPPINKTLVRTIIKRELGAYPEQIFAHFEADAFAAASIGQVHKAELKDGRKVAVKIQYPNVRETIDSDMAVAKSLARRIIKNGHEIDPYFDEIRSTLLIETDYLHEGAQIKAFKERFGNDRFQIPDWIEEYSTERVLCMSFLEGRHLGDFLEEQPSQDERNHFGQLIWEFFHEELRIGGYVHADTHPGNFLFTYDGKLGIIDFGCVKLFPDEFFTNYLKLLPSHLGNDEEAIRELYTKLEVINPNAKIQSKEDEYYNFARNYGIMFSKPYRYDFFDFSNPDFDNEIRHFTKEAPLSNEVRGSKHFLYTSRVHTGLYSILIKLGAVISTENAKLILSELLDMSFDPYREPVSVG